MKKSIKSLFFSLHQVVYKLDFVVVDASSQSLLDFAEVGHFGMRLHEVPDLLLVGGGDEGSEPYLALQYIRGEMADDGSLGETSLGGYLLHAHALIVETETERFLREVDASPSPKRLQT